MKKCTLFLLLVVLAMFGSQKLSTAQELWGMTYQGGNSFTGVIFKTDANGNNQNPVYSWQKENLNGRSPLYSELVQASNGKLYGMTYQGGIGDYGVLFEYDHATDAYTKKLDFDYSNGAYPRGSLMQASNGKLYGMTQGGGINGYGVLFEYDPATNTYTKKLDFDGTNKGRNPYGSLMQAASGKLYGMTYSGGTNNYGVLFEYDPATNTYTKKLDFDGTNKGSRPYGSLMQAANSKLYGMTQGGGTSGFGVLFEYDPATDVYTKKLDFDGTNKGRSPYGSLMQASSGKLYGMTYLGGTIGWGVLFEYDPATNTYTKKLDFNYSTQGAYPRGSLMQATNGKLYGMTGSGGISGNGVLFEYDPAASAYTKKLDFDDINKGKNPQGSLMQASNGKLYGMTQSGGISGNGVLFEYAPSTDVYTKKLDFEITPEGGNPYGSLVQASNGKFYGMTNRGGTIGGYGVLFEYDPLTNAYTKKLEFDGTNKGRNPMGNLIQAANGKLYGMTQGGGTYGSGVLFEYDPATNGYAKKLDFEYTNKGANPYGSLMQATNGKLYGMTLQGGISGNGVLFEYDPATNTYTKKLDFDGTNKGSYPYGSLMQATNGKLYGMTSQGGTSGWGVLFEYDPANDVYTKKLDFDGTNNGRYPYGSLNQATNGKLYGMTQSGGTFGWGVLFEYDPTTNAYTKRLDFDYSTGGNAYGSLMQASNSKLYGMTGNGGNYGYGVLFEFDPSTYAYAKKLDFSGSNGRNPQYSSLIEDFGALAAVCKNTTLQLDASGQATLQASDIDGGSTGNKIKLSVSKSIFNCGDVGENTVTLTATDINGVSATCNATVTVVDKIAPVIGACTSNVSNVVILKKVTYLGTTVWRGYLDETMLKSTITDNCSKISDGSLKVKFSKTVFMPNDWGDKNQVTITATDASGNFYSCTIKVIVRYPLKSGEIDIYANADNEAIQTLDMAVYPNPTKGKLTLDIWGLNNPEVMAVVYNMGGQVVFQEKYITEGQITLDLTGKISGMYLLKVFADEKEFMHKIILQER